MIPADDRNQIFIFLAYHEGLISAKLRGSCVTYFLTYTRNCFMVPTSVVFNEEQAIRRLAEEK